MFARLVHMLGSWLTSTPQNERVLPNMSVLPSSWWCWPAGRPLQRCSSSQELFFSLSGVWDHCFNYLACGVIHELGWGVDNPAATLSFHKAYQPGGFNPLRCLWTALLLINTSRQDSRLCFYSHSAPSLRPQTFSSEWPVRTHPAVSVCSDQAPADFSCDVRAERKSASPAFVVIASSEFTAVLKKPTPPAFCCFFSQVEHVFFFFCCGSYCARFYETF